MTDLTAEQVPPPGAARHPERMTNHAVQKQLEDALFPVLAPLVVEHGPEAVARQLTAMAAFSHVLAKRLARGSRGRPPCRRSR